MDEQLQKLFKNIDTKTLAYLYWNTYDIDLLKDFDAKYYMRDLIETYKILPNEGRAEFNKDVSDALLTLKKGYNRLVSIIDEITFHKLVWYKLVIYRHKSEIRKLETLYHKIISKLGGYDPNENVSDEINSLIKNHEGVIDSYKKRYKRYITSHVSSNKTFNDQKLKSILLSGEEESVEDPEESSSPKSDKEEESMDGANNCLQVTDKIVVDTVYKLRKIVDFENYI